VPKEELVSLKVYNTAGQVARVLHQGMTKPGQYTTIWDGTDAEGRRLAAGVYFYALATDERRLSRKVVLAAE
jgi:flagellar hook assembly protein FlgD